MHPDMWACAGVELGRISHAPSTHELFKETQALMLESAAPVMRRVKTFVGSLESLSEMEVRTSAATGCRVCSYGPRPKAGSWMLSDAYY